MAYLSVNPAALAEPPEFKRPAPDSPSAEEIAAVLNEAWAEPAWGLLLWLVMVTGCRRGELCALRWTDLDLQRGVVTIERSADQTPNGVQEKATKTGQKRRLAVDSYTVDLLKVYRGLCEEQCKSVGVDLARSAFLFSASPDCATPRRPDSITSDTVASPNETTFEAHASTPCGTTRPLNCSPPVSTSGPWLAGSDMTAVVPRRSASTQPG